MRLEQRLRKLEDNNRPEQEVKVIYLEGRFAADEGVDSPTYQRSLKRARQLAGLEHYTGQVLAVSYVGGRVNEPESKGE